MNRQGRTCDHCGRAVRKPGIIVVDNYFCSLACKRRFPIVLRRRMIAHYRQMAADASAWIAKTLEWNHSHGNEEPIDIEAFRLVKRGALEIVDALLDWGPIPERALRLINSAMLEAVELPEDNTDVR